MAATLVTDLLAGVDPAPAEAATVDTNTWYALVNRNSGKALDVSGASSADGASQPVDAQRRSNRQARFVDPGDGFHRLKDRHSGKLLDVAGASTTDGAVTWMNESDVFSGHRRSRNA
ncbi:Ricin-type beta-trefoil lectin domain-like [Streptomyces pini]|uniref:Ricin-type beta-trefoil lectin domain-like n=1 Tax=Streptomyces pini TaxID=1520580 RepID=A0A1I4GT14_9ACTN|nr:Ricin-type beta-trefoil lectin domain-like [Streptomyces pini]